MPNANGVSVRLFSRAFSRSGLRACGPQPYDVAAKPPRCSRRVATLPEETRRRKRSVDMSEGSFIEVDGEVVQRNRTFVFEE
ncbi:Leucyl aminopeptidase (aminopeptidase T) [Halorhabdus sp. SVX81]|nr:Leucyl aminopeptidase (aminopeptidase T) [Halorhabdus sp. SVX81]